MGKKTKLNNVKQSKDSNSQFPSRIMPYNPTSPKHGSDNVTLLIIFSCFIICLVISYDIGYTKSEIYHDPFVSVTLTLEDHFSQLRNSWKSMKKTFPEFLLFEPKRPGEALREGTLIPGLPVKAKHPVVLVPGVVTSKVC